MAANQVKDSELQAARNEDFSSYGHFLFPRLLPSFQLLNFLKNESRSFKCHTSTCLFEQLCQCNSL